MPPLPPTEIVLDSLRLNILPAAGGAALVMGLFLLLGRWAAALGSAAAIIVAFALMPWSKRCHVSPRSALR